MTPLKTIRFEISRGEFFRIQVHNYLATRWWTLLALPLLAIAVYFKVDGVPVWMLGFLALVIPAAQSSYFWIHTNSSDNRIFFLSRSYEFNGQHIKSAMQGSASELSWQHITRVIHRENYFLLYLSATQYIYVPYRAFALPEDLKAFEQLLREKQLVK